ncbi:macrophage mannose receptor 1-like [Acanthopagrus latus]|uniref:macrophage mannose receptor 1-like n=1 Tax=Acanthopagrus latus TaxID=8177 RepID=UPI00187CA8C6|nr:macrophage mannose receptor 1-like [Acanthopagrus latus]
MNSSPVVCVLLGVFLYVRAASLPLSVEASTAVMVTDNYTTPEPTTIPNITVTPTCCMTTPPSPSTTTTPSSPSPSQIMCPDGWEVFQGRCYYFVNEAMTWPQAQSNCAILESVLVSAHSAQVYSFLQQLTNNNGNQNAWLGGFYLQDQWLWIDGSWFYNNTWSTEYPESSNPCLLLNSYGTWSNSQCDVYEYSSICEKNSNVPPEMLCPQGWTGFQGRCYYYNSESLSWPAADADCASLGASLVSVHNLEEYSFLFQQTTASGISAAWLGGFYLDDQWLWLDGSWFYQGFFTQMSPDNNDSCLATYDPNGWSNYACDQGWPSFCVKEAAV